MIDRYRRLHPEWEIVEGWCGDAWSKPAAVADGYRSSTGDVCLIADGDSYVPPEAARWAVDAAYGAGWAMPHKWVFRLTEAATEALYRGGLPAVDLLERPFYRGVQGGGIVAVTRKAFDRVGGMEPRFTGWGHEDTTFAHTLRWLVGAGDRGHWPLIHLWHPPAPFQGDPPVWSWQLLHRYRDAGPNRRALEALIAERGEATDG